MSTDTRPASEIDDQAERLARKFVDAMLAEAGPNGFVVNPTVHGFDDMPEDERRHLLAACTRLVLDKQENDRAWLAWQVAQLGLAERSDTPAKKPSEVWP